MKLAWFCAAAALTGMFVTAVPLQGCSSDDTPAAGGTAADAAADVSYDICDTFTHSGEACSIPSAKLCFVQCKTGGCKCTKTASGNVWACTTDFSCYPDAAPVLDAAGDPPVPEDDAAVMPDASDAAASSDAQTSGG